MGGQDLGSGTNKQLSPPTGLSRYRRIKWNVACRGKYWQQGNLGQASATNLGWETSHSCCLILWFSKRFKYRILPETLSWLSGEWQSYNAHPTPTSFLVGEGCFILHSPKVRCSTRSALFQEGFFEQPFYFWCVRLY